MGMCFLLLLDGCADQRPHCASVMKWQARLEESHQAPIWQLTVGEDYMWKMKPLVFYH